MFTFHPAVLWGGNVPRVHELILALYELLVYVFTLLPSLLSSVLVLSFLLIYFLTRLLPDLLIYSFHDRPVLFPGRRF